MESGPAFVRLGLHVQRRGELPSDAGLRCPITRGTLAACQGGLPSGPTPFLRAFFSGFPSHSTTHVARGMSSARISAPPPICVEPHLSNSKRPSFHHDII